jgi:thimet oligopeptidase
MKQAKALWIGLLQASALLFPYHAWANDSMHGAFFQGSGNQIKARCQQVHDDVLAEVARLEKQSHVEDILAAWNAMYIKSQSIRNPTDLLALVSMDTHVRDESHACVQRLDNMWADILQHHPLYERIVKLKPQDEIDASAKQFLLEQFEKAGVTLPLDKRQQFKTLQKDINALSLEFQKNIANYKPDTAKLTFTEKELQGANLDALASFKQSDGRYVLNLSYPIAFNILENATNADTRKRYYMEFMKRGGEANIAILQQLSDKRREQAQLLGYKSYAAWALKYKMAATPERGDDFLNKIGEKVRHVEQEELNELNQFKIASGDTPGIHYWDISYYQNQLKATKYAISEQDIRNQFPTEASVDWVMQVASELYGITFKENTMLPRWHDSVKAYDAYEKGHYLGTFYLDLFPRANKFGHAAMYPIHQASSQASIMPVGAIVANFSKQGLNQMELRTLFHEFGHVLHILFANTRYGFLGMDSVKQDFIEAPSQIFEAWVLNDKALAVFKKACPSCAPIDKALIAKIKALENFGKGIFYARQRLLAAFDMLLTADKPVDVMTSFKSLQADTPLGYVSDTYMPASFMHLAVTDYAAGYYGYLWSEALVDDMLSAFGTHLMDKEVAKRYRELILQPGGEVEPTKMVTAFLGRTPNENAFFDKLDSISKTSYK